MHAACGRRSTGTSARTPASRPGTRTRSRSSSSRRVASTTASPAAGGVLGAAAAVERWLSRRWVAVGCLLVFGLAVALPSLIVLPPDDEGLFTDVESTYFKAH